MTAFLLLLLGTYLIGAIPNGGVLTRRTWAGDICQAGSGCALDRAPSSPLK